MAKPQVLGFLPDYLFAAERPLAYLLKTWLLALLPSLVLGWLASRLAPATAATPFADAARIPPAVLLVMLIVVGPFLETLIMAAVATGLNAFFGFAAAAIASAVLWGLFHATVAPLWGLVVWWPFLLLTITFLVWRPRGLWFAIGMATAIHALQNAVAGTGLLFG